MRIDADVVIPVAEVRQDFSCVEQIVAENGLAVLAEDECPKYILLDVQKFLWSELTDDEKIDWAAARIMKKYKAAFLELAK